MSKVKVRLAMVPVADLEFGENIRDVPVDVDGLVESVRELGILEPLVCWPNEAGTGVEVGMGKRRLTAARIVGLDEVPCVLRPRPLERERILMQLAENIERADMSPIDEARAFGRLIDLGVARKTIAHSIRRSENWVYQRTKLLDLPERIRMAVHRGTLPPFVALEFPISLGQDPDVLRRLEQIPELTDTTLRAFIRREWGQVAAATGKNTHRGVRVIAVPDHDAYELAKTHAKTAGIPVGEWTVHAIKAYAEQGASAFHRGEC